MLILSLFTLFMVFHSSWYLPLKVLISFLVTLQAYRIWQHPFPVEYQQLYYFMDEWVLVDRLQNKLFFDRHRIILDTGCFLLLELSGESPRKVLTLCYDQLTKDEHRQLQLMEKLQRKKKVGI